MPNPSKAKGSAYERAVVEFLATHGHPYAERVYGAGRAEDEGDIDGLVGWCIEAKNHREIDLAGFVDEAVREAATIDARLRKRGVEIQTFPVAIIKRRAKPVEDSYCVTPLKHWTRVAELLRG